MDSNLPPNNPSPPGPPFPPAQASGPPPLILPRQLPPRRRSNGWRVVAIVLLILLAVSLFTNMRQMFGSVLTGTTPIVGTKGPPLEEVLLEYNHSRNKVVVISVEGLIASGMMGGGSYSMVEYIRDQFERASRRPDVKAVILQINSPGGEVLASDTIYDTIAEFQEDTGKPVIAAMSSVAASGGYYVAAPCRWIVADEMTITGSIGVILSSFNFRGLMDKVGIQPQVYKSGRYKDMLSATRKETDVPPEERKMVQDLIDETFQKFKNVIVRGRSQAAKMNNNNKDSKGRELASDWEQYADGRIFSGEQAYKYGFVDELGNWDTAKERALKLAGIPDANFVEYRQEFSLANLFQIFGKSKQTGVKVDLGLELPRLQAGQLYFLSPSYLH
ncbi:MAG: signal peptide peptidase SppA [Verrucomicrobia subdivision 3 bacterium]|nr:signal peptide peptidase SppA [Limisphaerales bacterium]